MAEIDEQINVVTWCRMQGIRIIHIPNEGKRSQYVGRQLVAAGLAKGFPDLFIPIPKGGFHGMAIEMKFGKNTLTEEQRDWLRFLKDQGYAVHVSYSFEDARHKITQYMQQGD